MKFAIIGAGGVGSIYGGNLARIGHDVTMIDTWPEHVAEMQQNGLTVEGPQNMFSVPVAATLDPTEVAQQVDVALICVNSYDTQDAVLSAKIVLKESGYAATLQNGLGNIEILSAVLGANRVVGGIIFHSSAISGPGRVNHTIAGATHLGELAASSSARLETLADILTQADMNPVIAENIMATIWGKFVHNCGLNAICAITDLRPGHLQEVPAMDEFQEMIIGEALALVATKGITLPDPDPMTTIKEFCASKFHLNSMAQHLLREQQTEIDSLNGYVVQESTKLGLAAPYNDALTRLIKGRQYRPEVV